MAPLTKDLIVVRGDSATIEIGPVLITDLVTGNLLPVDLSQPGLSAWFTVKALPDDADPGLWQGTVGTGITLNSPASTDHNYLTVLIPKHTFNYNNSLFTADRVTLVYDCELDDGTRHETIARGNLSVIADVGHA